jgi:hypothetical protein
MLRFSNKPDSIFLLLIDRAIHDVIGQIEMDDDPAEQQEVFECLMPASSRLFDVAGAKVQLEALRLASGDEQLYKPTDYHWLLLYEVLEAYCEGFNSLPHGPLHEKYGIERLDFGFIAEAFFWDTDFLDSNLPDIPLELRQLMDVSPETFGLTAGLKPHPEELELKICDEEMVKEFEEHPDTIFVLGSKAYPSLSNEYGN